MRFVYCSMYSGFYTVFLFSALYLQYDPTFGNAFWNSSSEGFAMYLFLLLTNWALVCDVWYLPKTTRQVSLGSRSYPVNMGSWDGAVERELASHQCGPGSIPGLGVICGLSLLLALVLAPTGFSPGTPIFLLEASFPLYSLNNGKETSASRIAVFPSP